MEDDTFRSAPLQLVSYRSCSSPGTKAESQESFTTAHISTWALEPHKQRLSRQGTDHTVSSQLWEGGARDMK